VVIYHINKEMCTVSVMFPLFCPAPIVLDYNTENHIVDEKQRQVFGQTWSSKNFGLQDR
jgi:hypothetical protein